ncbi:hypothetical protein [Synoicihabitans lomoniglobus]|uniref:Uncharacterized protein n=1 Tax=Synoicihabitans lomoniglobus TaxID=2909285 RepID=A0AAE9ZU64_9BACT|nr:hypothetical protein [Opitutaceae bacterium LMO-M01]WED63104.1 hypothetical protein PXH66_12255 [Opitutaceae bacterium LMO-M01]
MPRGNSVGIGAHGAYLGDVLGSVGEPKFRGGEHLRFKRNPFFLARDCEATVVTASLMAAMVSNLRRR